MGLREERNETGERSKGERRKERGGMSTEKEMFKTTKLKT